MKIVGYHPGNPVQRHLPSVISTFSMYDTVTGQITALADGALLTAMRTGAASAVATRLLAKPDATCLGLVGCGAQAVTQLHALYRVVPLECVRLFDVSSDVLSTFADRAAPFLAASVDVSSTSLSELMDQSDIICTATSVGVMEGPVLPSRTTRSHLHINAVGADLPGKLEIPVDLLHRAFVCPDFLEQAVVEGECQQLSAQQIGASVIELGASPSTAQDLQAGLTVFDSTGWALEDFVAMELAMECATERGIGKRIPLECPLSDPWNPYSGVSHFEGSRQPAAATSKLQDA